MPRKKRLIHFRGYDDGQSKRPKKVVAATGGCSETVELLADIGAIADTG